MKLPIKDRATQPYMTEREIPAVKAALSAWRKLRRDKEQMQFIRDRGSARIVATPRIMAEQIAKDAAWILELLTQIEERVRKEATP